eukprot:gene13848-18572_t
MNININILSNNVNKWNIRYANEYERNSVKEFITRIHVRLSGYSPETIKSQTEDLKSDFPEFYDDLLWKKSTSFICTVPSTSIIDPTDKIISDAKNGELIVGAIGLRHHSNNTIEISYLFVDEHFQQKGIGTDLLRIAIGWILEFSKTAEFPFQYQHIRLLTLGDIYENAIKMYFNEGFTILDEEHNVYRLIYLQLDLHQLSDSKKLLYSNRFFDFNNYKTSNLSLIMELAKNNVDNVYNLLELLCICYPSRITGSESLEKSLDFLYNYGINNGIPSYNCQQEVVGEIPCWDRGDWREEYCRIQISTNDNYDNKLPLPCPNIRDIRVLANGLSIGTTKEGLSGEIIVVSSFDQLQDSSSQVKGKIVLYDYKNYIDYGLHAYLRRKGANEASKYGAIAVLIRSLTPDGSTSGPHTGGQEPYDITNKISPIPAACISVEDTELISRLTRHGYIIHGTLHLPCYQLADRSSRNLIFEIKGSEFPDEVVLIGGHTDSWDCHMCGCQGAHDDGQAVCICLEIIKIFSQNGLIPRRTIRAVLFTDEEIAQRGADEYSRRYGERINDPNNNNKEKIVTAIETDLGVGLVNGFGFTGTSLAREKLRTHLLKPISKLIGKELRIEDEWTGRGVDISPLIDDYKVPGLLLRHEDSWWVNDYFHLHHTNSDTIDKIDKKNLELNLQVLMLSVWILANTDDALDF